MKLAFTSTDGIMVNTHFGKTEKIFIYEIKRGGIFYGGMRKINAYSTGEPANHADELKLRRIYKAINDCNMLYTAAIGDVPMHFLQEQGLTVEIARGTINSVFLKL